MFELTGRYLTSMTLLFLFIIGCHSEQFQVRSANDIIVGSLVAITFDEFKSGEFVESKSYSLETEEKVIALKDPNNFLEKYTEGSRVQVSGNWRDAVFLVNEIDVINLKLATDYQDATQDRKIAFISFKFSDQKAEPYSEEDLRSWMFSDAKSVDKLYQEVSYGSIRFSGYENDEGDYFGGFEIEASSTKCSFFNWSNLAEKKAREQGFDKNRYQHQIYVFPKTSCRFAGAAVVGRSKVWINGPSRGFMKLVLAHEIGHNLGLRHAQGYRCRGSENYTAISDDCSVLGYADPFDFMGNRAMVHTNTFHKMQMGVLSPNNMMTVEKSGTYAIKPMEFYHDQSQVLRIKTDRTVSKINGNLSYYIEFRQPSFFDSFSEDHPVVNGVVVRLGASYPSNGETLLIDVTPETRSLNDASLAINKEFYDEKEEIRVKTLSITKDEAIVEIQLGSNQLPSVSFKTPSEDGAIFTAPASIEVEVEANDTDGYVESVTLYLDQIEIGKRIDPPYLWKKEDADTELLQNLSEGTYTLKAIARDNSGANQESLLTLTIEKEEENVLPEVDIISPENEAVFYESETDQINVKVNATDQDGFIDEVSLSIIGENFEDNKILSPILEEPHYFAIGINNLSSDIYTFRVTATDNDGGRSEKSITVVVNEPKKNIPPVIQWKRPSKYEVFEKKTRFTLEVEAFDIDGSVVKVQLYQNGRPKMTKDKPPYSWEVMYNQVGTFSYWAFATDNEGAVTGSQVTFTIVEPPPEPNQLPVVTFLEPIGGEILEAGSDVAVEVLAEDGDGEISNVSLFLNEKLVRMDSDVPFRWGEDENDLLMSNLEVGSYTLKAVAIDDKGGTQSSAVSIVVKKPDLKPNIGPVVTFLRPDAKTIFVSPDRVEVEVDAQDTDGTIDHVNLFINGSLIRKESYFPYLWIWDPQLRNLQPGSYILKAVATDNEGLSTTSEIPLTVTQDLN